MPLESEKLNEVTQSPVYCPHRVDVAAADSSAPGEVNRGLSGCEWRFANIDVGFAPGAGVTTGVTVSILYWSELESSFVAASPAQTFVLAAPASISIEHRGRPFWVKLSSLTGSAPVINVATSFFGRDL